MSASLEQDLYDDARCVSEHDQGDAPYEAVSSCIAGRLELERGVAPLVAAHGAELLLRERKDPRQLRQLARWLARAPARVLQMKLT